MSHAPKTAALEALASGRLSEAGERRIRKHLDGCEVCRAQYAAIHVYRDSREAILASRPELDWRRVEERLAREARSRTRSLGARWNLGRRGALAAALALAAAVVVAVGIGRGPWRSSSPGAGGASNAATASADRAEALPGDETQTSHPTVQPRYAMGIVSALAGAATFERVAGQERTERTEVSVGERLWGGILRTGALAQAHLALVRPIDDASEDDTSERRVARLALGPEAALEFGEFVTTRQTPELRTRLESGRMTVDAFESGSRVVVLAGAYRVEVRAAKCTIDLTRAGDGTARVSVAAADPRLGAVVVVDGDGAAHDLAAPSGRRVWSSDGAPAQLEDLPLVPLDGALVQVARLGIVRYEVDGQVIEGGPNLVLRVQPGLLRVRAFDDRGRSYRAEVSVGPEGLALTPDQLVPVRARVQGFLAPEDITPVVRQSQRALQRCYEHALRLRPDLGGGLLRARVTLDSQGRVRLVELDGGGAPESLETCVRLEAARWQFPPPGGPMSFELPLRFHASQ